MMDVTDYNNGNGKVRVRARMEVLNDKVIKIFELPYGVTADSLINSVEEAAKKGKNQSRLHTRLYR